jgi:hypothetical protein
MTAVREAGPPAVEALAWDSEHLGFPVARLADPDLEPAGLRAALETAAAGGFRLVYWPAAAGRTAPEPILREFAGLLVDRKATFALLTPAWPTEQKAGSGRTYRYETRRNR